MHCFVLSEPGGCQGGGFRYAYPVPRLSSPCSVVRANTLERQRESLYIDVAYLVVWIKIVVSLVVSPRSDEPDVIRPAIQQRRLEKFAESAGNQPPVRDAISEEEQEQRWRHYYCHQESNTKYTCTLQAQQHARLEQRAPSLIRMPYPTSTISISTSLASGLSGGGRSFSS